MTLWRLVLKKRAQRRTLPAKRLILKARPCVTILAFALLKDGKEKANAGTDKRADELLRATARYTFDGDRDGTPHESGTPNARDLVLGGDDPRDEALAEHILSEDVAWRGRIFDVDRLRVRLADGREALRDVVRHPGAVAIVALTDEGEFALYAVSRSSCP